MKTIVAAIDLSESSEEVLRWAKVFADRFGSAVKVVHVVHDLGAYTGIYLSSKPPAALQREMETEAQEKMLWFYRKIFGEGNGIENIVLRGHPLLDLVEFLKDSEAELLVVGCHGHRKPEHKLFGSTAERILKLSPCPVVTVGQDLLAPGT